ncbi:MAG: S8 family serine peptidase [Candidatus Heimdallarchaeota archaeon]|nr:MAG: S8 family serine peptidase [Candidatus Heimdallarchaeota archaeon]
MEHKKIFTVLLLELLLLVSFLSICPTYYQAPVNHNYELSEVEINTNEFSVAGVDNSSNLVSNISVIIQFSGEFLSSGMINTDFSSRFLYNKLSQLYNEMEESGLPISLRIVRTFPNLLGGVSAIVNPTTYSWLQNRKDISVWEDGPVQVLEIGGDIYQQSNQPSTAVCSLWNLKDLRGQNITGKGLTIAIIDTGVDYSHPDLGGGLGPIFRVKGGYDFVNDDPDPRDDNGHGTHVAGIVGANGSIMGVAPEVSFLAYKAFDEFGCGNISNIISAVEQAVLDMADILVLSFGKRADLNSPVSQVCERAFKKGLLIIAAAGNDGPETMTLYRPGVAKNVISVGAANSNGQVADFSSRGPHQYSWFDWYGPQHSQVSSDIKPDILGLGIDVNSTDLRSGYTVRSGTSMACPYVAGIAALIMQYQNTSAEETRTRLLTTADDKDYEVFTQGSGYVNATRAVIETTSLSSGRIDLTVLSNSSMGTFDVIGLTNECINVTLNLEAFITHDLNGIPLGSATNITNYFILSLSDFILNKNESQQVQLTTMIPSSFTSGIVTGRVSLHSNRSNWLNILFSGKLIHITLREGGDQNLESNQPVSDTITSGAVRYYYFQRLARSYSTFSVRINEGNLPVVEIYRNSTQSAVKTIHSPSKGYCVYFLSYSQVPPPFDQIEIIQIQVTTSEQTQDIIVEAAYTQELEFWERELNRWSITAFDFIPYQMIYTKQIGDEGPKSPLNITLTWSGDADLDIILCDGDFRSESFWSNQSLLNREILVMSEDLDQEYIIIVNANGKAAEAILTITGTHADMSWHVHCRLRPYDFAAGDSLIFYMEFTARWGYTSATLHYRVNNGEEKTKSKGFFLTTAPGGEIQIFDSIIGPFEKGDQIRYWFSVLDANGNLANSPTETIHMEWSTRDYALTLKQQVNLTGSPYALELGDLQEDGITDMVIGNGNELLVYSFTQNSPVLVENISGNNLIYDILIDDLLGSSSPEVIVWEKGYSISIWTWNYGTNSLDIVEEVNRLSTTDSFVTNIAIGDVDNDQAKEIIVGGGSQTMGQIHIIGYNQGNWGVETNLTVPYTTFDVETEDTNRNSNLEIIAAVRYHGTYVFEWSGDDYALYSVINQTHMPSAILFDDFDQDGTDELIVGQSSFPRGLYSIIFDEETYVTESNYDGANPHHSVSGLTSGDIDNDGWIELITHVWDDQLISFIGYHDNRFIIESTLVIPECFALWDASVVDIDYDGRNELLLAVDSRAGIASKIMIMEIKDIFPPSITSPSDIIREEERPWEIEWNIDEAFPLNYIIFRNGSVQASGDLNGSILKCSEPGLPIGTYNFTIVVSDQSNNSASDSVLVTITEASPSPTTSFTSTTSPFSTSPFSTSRTKLSSQLSSPTIRITTATGVPGVILILSVVITMNHRKKNHRK